MRWLIQGMTTLALLTAAVGVAGATATGVAERARGLLDGSAVRLEELNDRWADLGVPPELTAPVGAISPVAYRTLELPEEMTQMLTDTLSRVEPQSQDGEDGLAAGVEGPEAPSDVVAGSSNMVALGALEKGADGALFLIENAGGWEVGDGFYVHVRFIDLRGEETAFRTQHLDGDRVRTWELDLNQVEALPDGWRGVGLATVHDELHDVGGALSQAHRIMVRRVDRAGDATRLERSKTVVAPPGGRAGRLPRAGGSPASEGRAIGSAEADRSVFACVVPRQGPDGLRRGLWA